MAATATKTTITSHNTKTTLYAQYGYSRFHFLCLNWRLHAIHYDPFHLLRIYVFSSAQNGNSWIHDCIVRAFIQSFIACADEKIIVRQFSISNKMNEFAPFSALCLSVYFSRYVSDICLTLLKIYVQHEQHVPEYRLSVSLKKRNNTQYAICTSYTYN